MHGANVLEHRPPLTQIGHKWQVIEGRFFEVIDIIGEPAGARTQGPRPKKAGQRLSGTSYFSGPHELLLIINAYENPL